MFYSLSKLIFKRKWRKLNPNNFTNAEDLFDPSCVYVDDYTYGGLRVLTYNKTNKLKIGRFCSIAQNVMFILSADHYTGHISSYPFKVKIMEADQEGISKGDIVVEDDVWIGYGATIMSGVHIGQGAVIAAGAVVTKDALRVSSIFFCGTYAWATDKICSRVMVRAAPSMGCFISMGKRR